MPATSADVTAATRPGGVSVAIASDSAVLARNPRARDGQAQAAAGWWDSAADAQLVAAKRLALLKGNARRFAATVEGSWPPAGVLAANVRAPSVRFRDAELVADGPMLVSKIEVDPEEERTTVELFEVGA